MRATTTMLRAAALAAAALCCLSSGTCIAAARTKQLRPEWRGMLASPGLQGTAVKGVYFFPGSRLRGDDTYTTHPLDARDEQWNSSAPNRSWVIDRMLAAHVNTIVMSYWSDMPQWSPMDIGSSRLRNVVCPKHPNDKFAIESEDTVPRVLAAVRGRPLVVLPAIEEGVDKDCPALPQWVFADEFPFRADVFPGSPVPSIAPGLVQRIGKLVQQFQGHMNQWARLYDRDGRPRYAVQIIHAGSNVIAHQPGTDTDDKAFANGFTAVAAAVKKQYGIDVGFTLDAIGLGRRYLAFPSEAGAALESTAAVLALQGFASEVFSGLIDNGDAEACVLVNPRRCRPHDNNVSNLEPLADWKRGALSAWLDTGVPVLLDLLNGYDGRIVFGGPKADGSPGRAGFWGDNLDYTDDRWRNRMSQLKSLQRHGRRIKGIVFDTWNGYTEGYAAVPSVEHGDTVIRWLTDLLEPAPWECSHMHYVNGAPTHRVYGAICERWIQLGADRSFGAPVSAELPSTRGRMQQFTDGKAIYWSGTTGAFATYGLVGRAYREAGSSASCLGFPVSDEVADGTGRVSHFEHGSITWMPGDAQATLTCR